MVSSLHKSSKVLNLKTIGYLVLFDDSSSLTFELSCEKGHRHFSQSGETEFSLLRRTHKNEHTTDLSDTSWPPPVILSSSFNKRTTQRHQGGHFTLLFIYWPQQGTCSSREASKEPSRSWTSFSVGLSLLFGAFDFSVNHHQFSFL